MSSDICAKPNRRRVPQLQTLNIRGSVRSTGSDCYAGSCGYDDARARLRSESSNLKPYLTFSLARSLGGGTANLFFPYPEWFLSIFFAPLFFPPSLVPSSSFLPFPLPSESRVAATLAATYEANKSHCEGTNQRRNERTKWRWAVARGAVWYRARLQIGPQVSGIV